MIRVGARRDEAKGRSEKMSALGPELALRPVVTVPSIGEVDDDGGEECRTPTSEESKLPSSLAQSCPPPAPMKPRRALRCKRKLWPAPELITVGDEEIEQLFGCAKKRRCLQPDDN
ncbi:hypothetical protein BHE74_00019363 [Ensete ventricosum]|uniref:Uncharacterized protein n=1 Tax=Ensete ventricosum TaxID=4639 RepID=A0A444C6H0_ENSVE|nr:hypothetical protein B296_00046309 [Ensete ventricosum]RWV81477.1 hypothetical protein GW17_00057098 [Ensete ventricosum]RWW72808.1 hypothetical protein BHE74_00019363 [Ensete ventricosum]